MSQLHVQGIHITTGEDSSSPGSWDLEKSKILKTFSVPSSPRSSPSSLPLSSPPPLSSRVSPKTAHHWQNYANVLNFRKQRKSRQTERASFIAQLDILFKQHVNFFWRPNPKLRKLRDQLILAEKETVFGKRKLKEYTFDSKAKTYVAPICVMRRKIRDKIGVIKQKIRKLETWVVAYVVDKDAGTVHWGGVKWKPDSSSPVLTNYIRMQLKLWAAERMRNDCCRSFVVDPFKYVAGPTTGPIGQRRDHKNQVSKWYRHAERIINQHVYQQNGMAKPKYATVVSPKSVSPNSGIISELAHAVWSLARAYKNKDTVSCLSMDSSLIAKAYSVLERSSAITGVEYGDPNVIADDVRCVLCTHT